MSRRSQQGNAKGVPGGECERRLTPSRWSARGGGGLEGLPQKIFNIFLVLSPAI